MINVAADIGTVRRWIVCETDDRWLRAVRRFAAEMMPSPLVANCCAARTGDLPEIMVTKEPAIVLWEVHRESLAAACDCLAQSAVIAPGVLQIVAGCGLSASERIILSEFRCAATIRHPEELPGLTKMVHGYFATTGKNLD